MPVKRFDGGPAGNIRTFTGAATLAISDGLVRADTTAGPFTLTLPASPTDGSEIAVSVVGANQLTLAAAAGEMVDRASTYPLSGTTADGARTTSLVLRARASGWDVVSGVNLRGEFNPGSNAYTLASLPSAYPRGTSVFPVTAGVGGWPFDGLVRNTFWIDASGANAIQELSSDTRLARRSRVAGSDAWTALVEYAPLWEVASVPDPSWNGALTWSEDPMLATAFFKPNTGTALYMYARASQARVSGAVATVTVSVTTAGATLTASQNLIALYRLNPANSTWERVGLSADQSTAWTTTGVKTATMTLSSAVAVGDQLYIALLSVGTTPPTFQAGAIAVQLNFNGAKRRALWAGQTTLGTTLTLANISGATQAPWAAIT